VFLKWDEIFVTMGMVVWTGLAWRDLKREGRTDVSWMRLGGVMGVVGVVCGPGAAYAVMWAWREEVLAGIEGS